MADIEFLYGLMVGLMAKAPPPRNPLGIVIGIAIIATSLVVSTLLAKNLGEEVIEDTSKALWGIAFYVFPIISWLGYYFVVKKGRSISKTSKI